MTSQRNGRTRKRSGAAMVEAVIMLPVLAIILAGIMYVQARAQAQQGARLAARRCAWQHAMSGCEEIPEGCAEHSHAAGIGSKGSGASSDDDTAADADAAVANVIAQTGDSDAFSVPLIGPALEALFGSATQFTVAREVHAGGRGTIAEGHFHVLCNAKPTNPGEAIETAFCDATKLCKGSK